MRTRVQSVLIAACSVDDSHPAHTAWEACAAPYSGCRPRSPCPAPAQHRQPERPAHPALQATSRQHRCPAPCPPEAPGSGAGASFRGLSRSPRQSRVNTRSLCPTGEWLCASFTAAAGPSALNAGRQRVDLHGSFRSREYAGVSLVAGCRTGVSRTTARRIPSGDKAKFCPARCTGVQAVLNSTFPL